MSKQDIKMVSEFTQCRRGDEKKLPEGDCHSQLSCALDNVVVMAERYEALRLLTPREYTDLWCRNVKGENFDAMVDELVKARS